MSKVVARRDKAGGIPRYDQPSQLRQGIKDNLHTLAADQLAAVNQRRKFEREKGP